MHIFLLFPPEFIPQLQFWLNCFPTQKIGNLQEYIPMAIEKVYKPNIVLSHPLNHISLKRIPQKSEENAT